jgi:hypothetical protein
MKHAANGTTKTHVAAVQMPFKPMDNSGHEQTRTQNNKHTNQSILWDGRLGWLALILEFLI